jgi:hypothetical protein
MWKLIAACVALAGLTLLLPSEPSYDPMAWLVWGRELATFQLDTAGGPSWKPLPVLFTTLIAPAYKIDHGLPPALWMVVARAGALLAMALAFRLAARLSGGGVAGALAGLVAALALLLTPDWFQFAAHGSEAPLAVALMFWAIERHLDGQRSHALILGALTCLLRPELVPFLGVYGLWAWVREPRLRPLLAGIGVVLPLAWLVPEWIGAGNPLDAGKQAASEPIWSLSHAERPWLRALERVHNHAELPVELLALVAVASALVRRRAVVLALAAAALAEVVLYVAMTQAGFSGNPRYVVPALAVGAVLAGVGAGELARLLALRPTVAWRLAGAGAALAAVAVLSSALVDERVGRLEYEAREVGRRMQVHSDLAEAVRRAGGPGAVLASGTATSNRSLHTRLAWELEVPMDAVEGMAGHSVIFRSSRDMLVGRVFMSGRAKRRVTLVRVGSIRVYRREGLSFPIARREWHPVGDPFTSLLQGFHKGKEHGRSGAARVVTR